ncbi:MAG: ABC transporter permease [Aureispira sp.]
MNIEFLIAKRVGTATKKSFSRSILRLAVVAIALSMVVMILATSIVAGFKNTISEKIFGFWGHIHITTSATASSYAFETTPMNQTQDYYPNIDTIGHVQYLGADIDWVASIGLNNSNPLLLGALGCLLFAFIIVFLPILRRKFGWQPRWSLATLLSVIAIVLSSMVNYQLIEKDVVKETEGGIRHIQYYIHKEGIIKTKDQIEGIVLRGVGEDYDWEFLRQYIKEGEILDHSSEEAQKSILISETTAQRLQLKLNDQFLIYFVKDGNSLGRKFKVTGIYKTGLEEYDRRFALVDVRTLQQLNNWRPFKNYGNNIELPAEALTLRGLTAATAVEEKFWDYIQDHTIAGTTLDFEHPDLQAAVIPHQYARFMNLSVGDSLRLTYLDDDQETYTFEYLIKGIYQGPESIAIEQVALVHWQSINQMNQALPPQISGFELFVDNIEDLDPLGDYVNYVALKNVDQYANTIKELETNIFDWLSLTDMNERVILLLMILVSIINMTTSLMILILERTNMIGILKALGAANWSIRKIFLYNAAYIIGYGLFWGNLIGLTLCWLQAQFGIVKLPEDLYYVAVAPIELNWGMLLALNAGTLIITLTVLLIPSWLVSKIDPVKAIRFS